MSIGKSLAKNLSKYLSAQIKMFAKFWPAEWVVMVFFTGCSFLNLESFESVWDTENEANIQVTIFCYLR